MSETATRSNSSASRAYAAGARAPFGRVDDEPVGDRRRPRRARRSPSRARRASGRRRAGPRRAAAARSSPGWRAAEPRSRSSITSESTSRERPCSWKSFSSARASISASRPVTGIRKIVRAGWRSSRPASVARAFGRHSGGHQTMCVIVLVRSSGIPSAASRARSRPSWRSMSETTPTRVPSGGARSARRGGSGRPPPSGPRCRSRSSGSSAGRAARRRGSRRRASIAPRPRPRG